MVYKGRNLISKNTEEGFWTKLEPEVPPGAHQVSQIPLSGIEFLLETFSVSESNVESRTHCK